MVLDVRVAEIHADEVFKWFEEGLVEVKVEELVGVLQEYCHDIVDVLDSSLGDDVFLVTGSLQIKSTKCTI